MRILFILHSHPSLQAGGTEIFARDLFRSLRNTGVEGLFLAGTGAPQRPSSPGTPFQTVPGEPDELLIWTGGFDPFFMSQTDMHGVVQPLAKLLVEHQPDIVHIHHLLRIGVELVGLIRRCLPRARIVMTLHDYYAVCANDGQMVTTAGALCEAPSPDACRRCFPNRSLTDFKLRGLHIATALNRVDHFIAPSRFLYDRFVALGLPTDRISILPNGLPSAQPTPTRRGVRRDRFGFFGHINRFKGATVALEASARLSRAGIAHELTLHGSTEYQNEATLARFEEARSSAPNARYCGRYNRSDLTRLIAEVDWVIFPSEWWENAPLVINEALQHHRPVICSAIGGARELVQDGVNGLLFPVGDAAALAETMQRGIEEPGLWEKLLSGITPPVGIAESARRHLALYGELVSAPASRRVA